MSRPPPLIPSRIYVGLRPRKNSDLPPHGMIAADNHLSSRRKATIGAMATQSGGIVVSLDNSVVSGFSLLSNRRYDGYFTVRDPRGFDVNLSDVPCILRHATIERGAILNRCCYAITNNGGIVLLVEGSDIYDDAVLRTSLQSEHVSVAELRPGYTVLLRNGSTARYLGKMFPAYRSRESGVRLGAARFHFHILRPEPTLRICSTIQIGRVLDRTTLTVSECENLATDLAQKYNSRVLMCLASQRDIETVRFELEPVSLGILANANVTSGQVIGRYNNQMGQIFIYPLQRAFRAGHTTVEATRLDDDAMLNGGWLSDNNIETIDLKIDNTSWYYIRAVIESHAGSRLNACLD